MIRATILTAAIILGAGCSSDTPPKVDWSNYPPATKALIAEDTKAKDCNALQDTFDTFDRKGDSADLLVYIDWQMGKAGCK